MLFRNKAEGDVKFKVGANKYKVAPGATINLPDNVAFVVAKRGLPLERIEGSQAHSEPSMSDVGATLDALERSMAALAPAARPAVLERMAGIMASHGAKGGARAPKAEPKAE